MMFNKKAQSTAEYAIIIGLVVAAAMAMQVYVKRSLQGGIKFAVDKAGNRTAQYEPYYINTGYTTTRAEEAVSTEQHKQGGHVERKIIKADVTSRSGFDEVLAPPAQE